MIADLKPYPEYKDSGSRWLAGVPRHWEVHNLRTLIRHRNERNRADLPLLSVAREKGVFVRSLTDANENHNVIPEDLSNYKVARAGNLVINKMKAWQGSMGIAPCDGIVSPAYFVFDFDISNRAFGQTLLRSKPYVAHFGQASDGVRVGQWDLTIPGMRQIPVLAPSPEEQAAIVRFLDWANGRLERTIRAKRKVIKLLNEQKQAIIHRAVTRGLDPNVPLKNSGIPWLNEVPKAWELTKLRRVCFYQEGPGLRTWQFTESGVQVICVTNITAKGVNLGAYGRFISRDEYAAKYRHFTVERGDVMLASSGNSWGKIAEFSGSETVILNTSTIRLNPTRFGKVSTPFLKLVLVAEYVHLQLQSLLTGSCQPNFGPSHLNRVIVTFPPDLATQAAIVSAVSSEISPLDTAITRLEREIELLREYRTRLVADVVTGKLDVREATENLPDIGIEPATDDAEPDEEANLAEVEGLEE